MCHADAEQTTRIPLAVRVQLEAARRLGFRGEVLDPEYGYLFELRDGQRREVLYAGRSPLNDSVAARVCEDKYFTEVVLRRAGLCCVESVRCFSPTDFRAAIWIGRGGPEPGLRFAATHAYPLVVKPNRLSHGLGIRLVANERELRAAIEATWQYDYCALVQARVPGVDLRLDFLDGEYLMGYVRKPLVVVGDGRATLRQLLATQDARFAAADFWEKATRDPVWRRLVAEHNLGAQSVLPAREQVRFEADILNLNRWATATVIPAVSAAWRDFCVRIGDLFRLRHFGVDVKVPTAGAEPDQATLIEVNSSPLLTQLYGMGYREEVIAAQMRVLRAHLGS